MIKINIGTIYSTLSTDNLRLLRKLRDVFSVYATNFEKTEAYQSGRWDGKTYFITEKGRFYTGLLPMVLKVIQDYDVEIIDNRLNKHKLSEDLDFNVGSNVLYPEQQEAVKSLNKVIKYKDYTIPFYRGIYDLATNSGKSMICFSIINNFIGAKSIILVHREELLNQMYELFSPFYKVGIVHKKRMDLDCEVVIAMIKTLFNRSKEVDVVKKLHTFDIVFSDECHTTGGTSQAKEVLKRIEKADIRIGMSGTPLNNLDQVININTVGIFGKALYKISNKELIDLGRSTKPTLIIYKNISMIDNPFDYEEEYYHNIVVSEYRLGLIIDIIRQHTDKNILISFNLIEHGKFMYEEIIKSKVLPLDQIDIVHGTDKNRTNKLDSFKSGRISCLLSSMILKEGVNIPNIEVLILAHGGKSVITLKQYIGRGLRKGDKEELLVYDFIDDGKWCLRHSKERLKLYKNEDFEIKYM